MVFPAPFGPTSPTTWPGGNESVQSISAQRIARELHDVVAHSMSLIAVQAGVANYVINDNPREAARALSSIEQTSRGALHEMRALLGVLRSDGTATDRPGRTSTWCPNRDWPTWTVWSSGPPTPGSGSTSTSAAARRRCPPDWTSPPTG